MNTRLPIISGAFASASASSTALRKRRGFSISRPSPSANDARRALSVSICCGWSENSAVSTADTNAEISASTTSPLVIKMKVVLSIYITFSNPDRPPCAGQSESAAR